MSDDTPAVPPKRIGLFAPLILLALLVAGWSAYWVYTAGVVTKALQAQQAGLIKHGYQVSVEPYHVGGYPYRMSIELKNLTIITKAGRGVKFPVLKAEANAYALDKWVMVAPAGLTIYRGRSSAQLSGYDLGKLTVTGTALRASFSGLRQPIQTVAIQGNDVRLEASDPTHPFAFESAELFEAYLRPHVTPGADKASASASADAFNDSADWLIRLSGARGQSEGQLQGFVGKFSPQKPLNLHIEGTLNQMHAFRAVDFATGLKTWKAGGVASGFKCQLKSGDLDVLASSDALGFDADNRLTGHMSLHVAGTTAPLDVLAAAGLISQDNMTLAKPLLDMTLVAVGPQTFGIDFKKGGAYMGPLKVSDAPILP